MMEFILKSTHRRGWLLNILHALANILYVAMVFALVVLVPSTPVPALLLILLAKWRIVAVRPRFWWANVLSNLPDMLVGMSIVVLMWLGETWPVQVALAVLYAVWLVIIKPHHKRQWVMVQAGVSQFLALTALFAVGYMLPVWLVIMLAFVIGFVVARQVLGAYEEEARAFLSAVWGLCVMELAFMAWHWTIAYQITPTFKIAQFAIIMAVLGFVAERVYRAWRDDEVVTWREIRWPVAFASAALIIVLVLFGGLWGGVLT